MDHVAGIGDDPRRRMEFAELFVALADKNAGVRGVIMGLAAEAVVEERGGQFGDVLLFAKGEVGFVGVEEGLGVPAREEFIEGKGEEKTGPFGVVGKAALLFGFGG